MKKISQNGIDLIKSFEGYRGAPYRDSVGVCTIGYGTTHYEDGTPVKCGNNKITKEKAEEILRHEIDSHYGRIVSHYVRSGTTQNEFDAMVSFAYNLGVGALKTSHLLKYHNKKANIHAAQEFTKWIHAGGKVLPGLIKRRKMEEELYLRS